MPRRNRGIAFYRDGIGVGSSLVNREIGVLCCVVEAGLRRATNVAGRGSELTMPRKGGKLLR